MRPRVSCGMVILRGIAVNPRHMVAVTAEVVITTAAEVVFGTDHTQSEVLSAFEVARTQQWLKPSQQLKDAQRLIASLRRALADATQQNGASAEAGALEQPPQPAESGGA